MRLNRWKLGHVLIGAILGYPVAIWYAHLAGVNQPYLEVLAFILVGGLLGLACAFIVQRYLVRLLAYPIAGAFLFDILLSKFGRALWDVPNIFFWANTAGAICGLLLLLIRPLKRLMNS